MLSAESCLAGEPDARIAHKHASGASGQSSTRSCMTT